MKSNSPSNLAAGLNSVFFNWLARAGLAVGLLLLPLLVTPVLDFSPSAAEIEDETGIKIVAWDFSDLSVQVRSGDACAEFLAYLMGPAKNYKLLSTSTVQGPPGVVYTLRNNRGEIGVLKCSAMGGHDDGGGGCGG